MMLPLRILYIDNSPVDRELVRNTLERTPCHFQVREATSRQEFDSLLLEGNYDVVLSDCDMPGLERLQVLDTVRVKAPYLPVIIITGVGSTEIAVEAMKRGADDYVIKTAQHIQQLPATIHAVVEKKRVQQEREHAQEALREEAATTTALVRFGRELLSFLGTPFIVERLCQLSVETLQCDYSYIFLWRAKENAYRSVASWGNTPPEQHALTTMPLPRHAVMDIEARMRAGEEAIAINPLVSSDFQFSAQSADEHRPQAYLHVALRQGRNIFGQQVCVYLRPGSMALRHLRIAQGISQLASFVFAHVNLSEELQQANRIKADFLATISHELRTPLNIIIGYTNLLLEGMFGALTHEQTTPLQRVDYSAKNLLTLITDTLDLSRLETGQLPLDVREVNLHALLNEIQQEIQGARTPPHIHFLWRIPSHLPYVYTDSVKLKIIIRTLLNNALKFTERGNISVSAVRKNDGVEISVADTGIGIPQDELPFIFEPFHQGQSSTTCRYGGVGLGLYIARRLLELLGGQIIVESVEGRGSTFRFQLPFILPQ
jgi:signal transduction histidine kinase/FixJ family two-component response regulator